VRRTAFKAEFGVKSLEPVDDAAGTQSLATFRLDHVALTADIIFQSLASRRVGDGGWPRRSP
jgi:hypothetical protein